MSALSPFLSFLILILFCWVLAWGKCVFPHIERRNEMQQQNTLMRHKEKFQRWNGKSMEIKPCKRIHFRAELFSQASIAYDDWQANFLSRSAVDVEPIEKCWNFIIRIPLLDCIQWFILSSFHPGESLSTKHSPSSNIVTLVFFPFFPQSQRKRRHCLIVISDWASGAWAKKKCAHSSSFLSVPFLFPGRPCSICI